MSASAATSTASPGRRGGWRIFQKCRHWWRRCCATATAKATSKKFSEEIRCGGSARLPAASLRAHVEFFRRARRFRRPMRRIALAQPVFNDFALRGEQDALPFYDAGTLVIFGHQIRSLVENMNQIGGGAFELKGRKCGVVLLHLCK